MKPGSVPEAIGFGQELSRFWSEKIPTLNELFGGKGLKEATQEDLDRMMRRRLQSSLKNLKGGWFVGGYVTKDTFKNTPLKTSPHSKEASTQSSKSTEPSKKNE